jgi:hypothetical protein
VIGMRREARLEKSIHSGWGPTRLTRGGGTSIILPAPSRTAHAGTFLSRPFRVAVSSVARGALPRVAGTSRERGGSGQPQGRRTRSAPARASQIWPLGRPIPSPTSAFRNAPTKGIATALISAGSCGSSTRPEQASDGGLPDDFYQGELLDGGKIVARAAAIAAIVEGPGARSARC